MKRPTFSLRDLLWLMLVVGMGLGGEAERLQALTVKGAKAKLLVAEAEFAQVKLLRATSDAVNRNEFRRAEFQLRVAQAELESARARQIYVRSP